MYTTMEQGRGASHDAEVNIGTLESSVRMVDDTTFLSPQMRRQIMQMVLQVIEDRESHQMRVRAEQRIGGGVRADPENAERRMRAFAERGVLTFVDLTHPADALWPYEHLLPDRARRIAHPIVDLGTTTVVHMTRILDDVDAGLEDDRSVYVHCWGGIGRTGTVVGGCEPVNLLLEFNDPPWHVRSRGVGSGGRDQGWACQRHGDGYPANKRMHAEHHSGTAILCNAADR